VGISMGFMEGLPNSRDEVVIFAVVDKLSKYAYFLPLSYPFIVATVAQSY